MAELSPQPLAFAAARSDRWVLNRAAQRLLGQPCVEGQGCGLDDLRAQLGPEDMRELDALLGRGGLERAQDRPGRATCRIAAGVGGAGAAGLPARTLQLDLHAIPPMGDGQLGRLLTFADVTELVEQRDWLAIQVEELRHRIRNLFAVISGLAQMGRPDGGRREGAHSGRPAGELAGDSALDGPEAGDEREAGNELATRVQALAAAQAALDDPGGMPVGRLCAAVLEPFWQPGRIEIMDSKTAIYVPGDKATPLALALHELATNAVKHGALANRDGHLRVEIRVDEQLLHLDWVETGAGAPRPLAGGFGSRLLAMSVERQLGGRMERRWEGSVLQTRIAIPLSFGAARLHAQG